MDITTRKYNNFVLETGVYPDLDTALLTAVLGLCEEAGEVAGKVRKNAVTDGTMFTDEQIANELGDTLWYLTSVSNMYGYSLHDLMRLNTKKLKKRLVAGNVLGTGDDR